MKPLHLVMLWHMHQPQYRDPATGSYLLPWTRMHALKDYYGMVRMLEEFPRVHATFNVVPALALQLEEYSSGQFDDVWFRLAFLPAADLTGPERLGILERAFQVNYENLLSRWPRFVEIFSWVRKYGNEGAVQQLSVRDWRDLQVLSQLAWMDEEDLARDAVIAPLARKGQDFTEEDKLALRIKQIEFLARVLPEYRRALERGQIEISTTPFYHPILPLLCDTTIARIANLWTAQPNPPFQHPEDARAQLERAREYHTKLFGRPPAGLWPSEGSVSDAALEIAANLGFRWFATDEGILGRTRNIGFARNPQGIPENADSLYSPWNISLPSGQITGLYRDHQLSDLVGFVYSRMSAESAAEDLHRRIRAIGESWQSDRPATVCLILDGENAWEYYPGNGREFLRQFYRRLENDPEIRALTASEAIAAAGEIRSLPGTFPGSWINANFDIWIGHPDDVRAWDLVREARNFYQSELERRAAGIAGAPTPSQLERAYESILAAEGSDWCWWYGPENSSANDADFDLLFRKHLTGVYLALGQPAPDILAQPLRRVTEPVRIVAPSSELHVTVDGRESSYFEWLGAGLYAPDRRSGAMHGRAFTLGDLHYGFSSGELFLRVDSLAVKWPELGDSEFRLTLRAENLLLLRLQPAAGAGMVCRFEGAPAGLSPSVSPRAAFDRILEIAVPKPLLSLAGVKTIGLSLALWRGGLPVDVLPLEGFFEIQLGEDAFSWALTG